MSSRNALSVRQLIYENNNWRALESGLDIRIHGKLAAEYFLSMTDAFFEMGGQHLGVTVVDRETLLRARAHPEDYQDLCVRVTGAMARGAA